MGWLALIHHTSFPNAIEIADSLDNACVSLRQYEKTRGIWDVKPIINRVRVRDRVYDYFEDGTFKEHYFPQEDEDKCTLYAPYYYMPDKIRYLDLVEYIRDHLEQFRNVYDAYAYYVTEEKDEFLYSLKHGLVQVDIKMLYHNPMLYFQMGSTLRKV